MSFDIAIEKRRGDAQISCRIEGGEGITVLFGPSGVGKTSVLDMVAGLLEPDTGYVRVGGETLFDAAIGEDVPHGIQAVVPRPIGKQESRIVVHANEARVAAAGPVATGMGRGVTGRVGVAPSSGAMLVMSI